MPAATVATTNNTNNTTSAPTNAAGAAKPSEKSGGGGGAGGGGGKNHGGKRRGGGGDKAKAQGSPDIKEKEKEKKPNASPATSPGAKSQHQHQHHQGKREEKAKELVKEQPKLHPLNRSWTLWYDSPSTYNAENWELSLLPIMSVETVEMFFVMLRYMKPLHDLRTSSQYHFFQAGVKPMWEDEANKEGGKIWVNIEIPSTPTSPGIPNSAEDDKKSPSPTGAPKSDLDQMWERVLMAIVGEYLEPSADADTKEGGGDKPQIVGVVMAKRKYHNRLALWVRDAKNTAAIEAMKKKLKEEAGLPASASIVFTKHGEAGPKN